MQRGAKQLITHDSDISKIGTTVFFLKKTLHMLFSYQLGKKRSSGLHGFKSVIE